MQRLSVGSLHYLKVDVTVALKGIYYCAFVAWLKTNADKRIDSGVVHYKRYFSWNLVLNTYPPCEALFATQLDRDEHVLGGGECRFQRYRKTLVIRLIFLI